MSLTDPSQNATNSFTRRATPAYSTTPIPPAVAAMPTVSDVLNDRGKRYGVFMEHADVSQQLKRVVQVQLEKRDKRLAEDQQEALDMICHKIGRIINGDADYDDSWVDIAGYAQLVVDRLRNMPR